VNFADRSSGHATEQRIAASEPSVFPAKFFNVVALLRAQTPMQA
jgi:hypothetical protein